MSEAAAEQPVCPRHPGAVTYVRCQRCERPTCPQCQVAAPVGVLCVDCVRDAQKQARPVRSSLGFTAAYGKPWATYVLMAACLGVYFVAPVLLGRYWFYDLGLLPEAPDRWWSWVTSGFVHFGLLHLILNMFMLWQFGTQLEPAMGRVRYLALYVVSLLGSSAMVVLLGSHDSVHGGASGAIFGLLAGYAIVLRSMRLQWTNIAAFAAMWLVAGFFVGGISWEGHLGGAIAGAAAMALMLRSVQRRRRP